MYVRRLRQLLVTATTVGVGVVSDFWRNCKSSANFICVLLQVSGSNVNVVISKVMSRDLRW